MSIPAKPAPFDFRYEPPGAVTRLAPSFRTQIFCSPSKIVREQGLTRFLALRLRRHRPSHLPERRPGPARQPRSHTGPLQPPPQRLDGPKRPPNPSLRPSRAHGAHLALERQRPARHLRRSPPLPATSPLPCPQPASPTSTREAAPAPPRTRNAPTRHRTPGSSLSANGAPSPVASPSLPRKPLPWGFGVASSWGRAPSTFPCSHESFATTPFSLTHPGNFRSTRHEEMKTGDGATGWLTQEFRASRDGLGQYAKTPAAPDPTAPSTARVGPWLKDTLPRHPLSGARHTSLPG